MTAKYFTVSLLILIQSVSAEANRVICKGSSSAGYYLNFENNELSLGDQRNGGFQFSSACTSLAETLNRYNNKGWSCAPSLSQRGWHYVINLRTGEPIHLGSKDQNYEFIIPQLCKYAIEESFKGLEGGSYACTKDPDNSGYYFLRSVRTGKLLRNLRPEQARSEGEKGGYFSYKPSCIRVAKAIAKQ